VNVGKSGVSTSLGGKGASLNVGRRSRTSLSGASAPSKKRANRAASRLPLDLPETYAGVFISGVLASLGLSGVIAVLVVVGASGYLIFT